MRQYLKIFVVLAALAALFALGCGQSEEKAEQTAPAQSQEAAPEAAPAVPEITFASDCTWPPMEFLDADKNIIGFCPELVRAMGEAGGFTPVIKNTAWDGIFAGLAAGKYDVIASSVSITEERKGTMDFSDPYFEVKQGVLVQQDAGIETVEDLNGKTIGAQIGTTGYFAANSIEGAEAKSYDEVGLAVEDLFNGRIDAAICDDAVAYDYALQNERYKERLGLAFILETDQKEYLGFAVQQGDTETVRILNEALAKVKASGKYDEIYAKWFK
jgi:polar amino acid transport system substrate-binding protein